MEKENWVPKEQPSSQKSSGEVQDTTLKDLPNIRLQPEQIEEIHADEYSLKLFYATRVQALSLGEVKRRFPEPSPKKALSVLTRYVDCGLVHITSEGKYYSNFPENYINYSDYKYDSDLEAKKDAKVFEIMKENTGKPEYWKTRAYYSIDSFFTPEQTLELKAMFQAIKFKSKQFAHDNAKKGKIDGLNFRRLKFYDMILSLLFVFSFVAQTNFAHAGNDPGVIQQWAQMDTNIYPLAVDVLIQRMYEYQPYVAAGGGNDPGRALVPNGIRALPYNPMGVVRFNMDSFVVQDSINFKSALSAGGYDPDSSISAEEIESCEQELMVFDGDLGNVQVDCLYNIERVSVEECFGGNEDLCNLVPKINYIYNSIGTFNQ